MLTPYDTDPIPPEFAPSLTDMLRNPVTQFKTPTARVVRALRDMLPQVGVAGFRASVRKALWTPAVKQYLGEAEGLRVLARMQRRFGIALTKKYFQNHHDSLQPWYGSYDYVTPDAYLVDGERTMVVAYEIEDTHHLTPQNVEVYSTSWWSLDELEWSFYLVAYDVYGQPRVFDFPIAGILAGDLVRRPRRKRSS